MAETPSAPPGAADDLVSRVLAGRYRVDRPLRRGGMGAVYVARDLKDDRDVAVKVVRQALLEDPQALARFKREARLVTELSHDNIVRSFDAGDDAGLLWIAMELLEGESLRDRLDARGRIAWIETLPLIEQIAQALGAAHDQGIIHRDLKPENVMLIQRDGTTRAKLLDFGVAKQAHVEGQTSGTSNMTGTGLIVGTPGYVAPEVVLEGTTDDQRSDFYALGVVWFEMLTGQKPFTAKTAFALAMRHAHEPAPTPTSLVPYSPVPAPIERVVLRLLAKNPNDRPKDARELLISLTTLAEESQRSLAGTPSPTLLDGNPHDATVTDLADIHRTGVVPFKGTPPKAGLSDPLHSSPGASAQNLSQRPDMTGTGTPATAQHLGGGGMTPPGATPLPQLLGQIPKKYFAAAFASLVVLIAGVSIAVLVVANRVRDDDDRLAREARADREAREMREEREARDAREELRSRRENDVVPPPPHDVAQLPPPVPDKSETPAPTPPTDPEPDKKKKKRDDERRVEKRNEEKPSDGSGVVIANANAPGKLFVRPLPVEGEWTISVKGGYPLQSPLNLENAAPGTYALVVESKKLNAKIPVTVEVKPGESTRLVKDFRSP